MKKTQRPVGKPLSEQKPESIEAWLKLCDAATRFGTAVAMFQNALDAYKATDPYDEKEPA